VRSQAPCTFPSVNSILTSRLPPRFLDQPPGHMGIPDGVRSVAEILTEQGFVARAVSASAIVRATPSRFNPHGGFRRGFETFDERCLGDSAYCVNTRAFALEPSDEKPWLLYLHYMDPHGPYRPPPDHKRRFARYGFPDLLIGRGDPLEIDTLRVLRTPTGSPPLRPEELQHLIDLYDEEIFYWDRELLRLFTHLKAGGRLDDTMIVLLADHGEGFLEHGTLNHCRSLYENETRTPLVMWIPGVTGRRVEVSVENLDVVPTLLDYLGVRAEADDLEGRSLRSIIEQRTSGGARYVHAVHNDLRSVDDGRWKEIRNVVSGDRQVFDLQTDPGEKDDRLSSADPSVVRDLEGALSSWIAEHEGAEGSVRNAERGGRVIENLKALGYLQ
jgi:arylsulfatase A-like enzyme